MGLGLLPAASGWVLGEDGSQEVVNVEAAVVRGLETVVVGGSGGLRRGRRVDLAGCGDVALGGCGDVALGGLLFK